MGVYQKEKGEQDKILKEIIAILENDVPSQTDINKLTELQSELDCIYQNRAKGAFVGRTLLEHCEKNTKYFHNLEKRNQTINSIHKLKVDNITCDDPQKISLCSRILPGIILKKN